MVGADDDDAFKELLAEDEQGREDVPPRGVSRDDREGCNKTTWGDGPWQTEPDRVEFVHVGVACLMMRHAEWGSWNAYAAVEPGHPWHGNERAEEECIAHGGITWCGPSDQTWRLLSRPRQLGNHWWIGFDCGHAFDFQPGLVASLLGAGIARATREFASAFGTTVAYRDQAYVTEEVKRVAEQVVAARRH